MSEREVFPALRTLDEFRECWRERWDDEAVLLEQYAAYCEGHQRSYREWLARQEEA